MRVSCNGCRVLRKGCSEDCCIRPCLHWISSSHSQANATLFLAKFYGRAGLVNLINTGPHHLRPRIFKSLLYEACGRIIDPIHGAVGLMTSGKWNLCDEAVEAVLSGTPITTLSPEYSSVLMVDDDGAARKACDIRHVPKSKHDVAELTISGSDRLHKVKSRKRFKRSSHLVETKQKRKTAGSGGHCNCKWSNWCNKEVDESVSGQTEVSRLPSAVGDDGDSSSVETVAAAKSADGSSDVELELTLGLIGWC